MNEEYGDLYLKFTDEASANEVLFITEPAIKPVLVTDAALETILDGLSLADAETDQTVQHDGKTYMADTGKWCELVAYDKPVAQRYTGSIDIIGEIEGATGWHVNTRGPMTEELKAFAVVPTNPRRVGA